MKKEQVIGLRLFLEHVKIVPFFRLFIRTISFHHELSIDPHNSDFSMMSDASYNVLTEPRKKIFVKMSWVKL